MSPDLLRRNLQRANQGYQGQLGKYIVVIVILCIVTCIAVLGFFAYKYITYQASRKQEEQDGGPDQRRRADAQRRRAEGDFDPIPQNSQR